MNRIIVMIGDNDKIHKIINPNNLICSSFSWTYNDKNEYYGIKLGDCNVNFWLGKKDKIQTRDNYEKKLSDFVNALNYNMSQHTLNTHNLELNLTTFKIDVYQAR